MKTFKLLLLAAPVLLPFMSRAQWTTSGSTVSTSPGITKVGINTTSPTDMFTIQNGDLGLINPGQWSNINCRTQDGGLKIGTYIDPVAIDTYGPMIELGGAKNGIRPGQILYFGYTDNTKAIVVHSFMNYNSPKNATTNLLQLIDDNGKAKAVIGNVSTPGSYGLYVERGILTESVRVALKSSSSWADYVFAKDYQLRPLSELASYIKDNEHLPDVPSAKDVVKDGIDIANMDATLLKKIEELTLYVIKQQQEIEALKQQVNASKN